MFLAFLRLCGEYAGAIESASHRIGRVAAGEFSPAFQGRGSFRLLFRRVATVEFNRRYATDPLWHSQSGP